MKLYKTFVNEDDMTVYYKTFEALSETDFSNDPETNLYDAVHGHMTSLESAEEYVSQTNELLKKGLYKLVKCVDCGIYFTLIKSEIDWYKKQQFNLPKRCNKCRKLKRSKVS